MVRINEDVWSEFSIEEQYIKVAGQESYTDMSCVGTAEHELESKTVRKKCKGVVVKQLTRGTGNGTLTEKLHVPRTVYNMIYNMNRDDLKDGIVSYGQESRHPEFSLTMLIENEDGDVMLRAYPRCKIMNGPKKSIENGAEEVAELDLTISILPDEYGTAVYDALKSELSEDIAKDWLTKFTPEFAHIISA